MSVWKMVGRLILYKPRQYIASLLLWSLIQGLPLVTGLLLQRIFNLLGSYYGLSHGHFGIVVYFLVATLLIRAIALFPGFYIDFSFTFVVAALVRQNLFKWLMRRPIIEATQSMGDSLSRIREDIEEIAGFCSWTTDLIYRPIFVALAITVMARINLTLALVVLLPLGLLMIFGNLAKARIGDYRQGAREATGSATEFLADVFGAIETVQTSRATKNVVQRLRVLNKVRGQFAVKEKLYTELLNSVQSNSTYLGTGLILLLVVGSIRRGTFTLGDLALFTFYLAWLGEMTQFLARLTARFRQVGVSFARAIDLQGAPASYLVESVDPTNSPSAIGYEAGLKTLEVQDLTFYYPGSVSGIEGINFSIKKGDLLVITGEVGSGKTTLMRAIIGLLPKQKGSILWNGKVVDSPWEFFIPPRAAYTPQVPHLFTGTWKENIVMGEDCSWNERLVNAVNIAALKDDIEQTQLRLDTPLGAQGTKLSGGQHQRTAIARMLYRHSELLFMDDVSSAVDFNTELNIWGSMRTLDSTFIVISNKISLLKMADSIIVLKNGRIESVGTLPQIAEYSNYIQNIL